MLGEVGLDAVLEPGARPRKTCACAAAPAGRAGCRGDPHDGQRADPLQPVHPVGVELVGLVDAAHHDLRLVRVHQGRHLTGRLDLLDDPIPVAGGLHRHGGARLDAAQGLPDGSGPVFHALVELGTALGFLARQQRISLVRVQTDVFFHGVSFL